MNITLRSHLTAGVAVIGAGAIALTPVQPLNHGLALPPALTGAHAVQLAAFDVVTPWLEVFDDATVNIAQGTNSLLGGLTFGTPPKPVKSNSGDGNTYGAPLPVVQQMFANGLKYLTELNDIPGIVTQIIDNAGAAIRAPWTKDLTTLDGLHALGIGLLPVLAPDVPQFLLDLITTSGSGMLAGILGPVLGPFIALSDSIAAISAKLGTPTPDWSGAFNDLLNIPAAMTGAFLNGGPTLDLSFLIPVLGLPTTGFPRVNSLGFALGGLLSPGGSLWNSVSTEVQVPTKVTVPGVPTGFLGSLMGVGWEVASAIGWDRNGNPLKPGITVPGGAATRSAPLAAAAEDNPVVDDTVTTKVADVADDPAPELDAPKALSQSDETEAPAPRRQTHRDTSGASSDNAAGDNDSDSGSRTSRRHVG